MSANPEGLKRVICFLLSFLGIAGASFICYWSASNLFFIADDFLWLERAKYLAERPLSIFRSEGLYFDPLIYLLFGINYILGGLEPRWYHLVDLFIHILNAFLVFNLALLLTENKIAAFFPGLIFAVWPINADAVLWPSSRVDTLSALFFLTSIISYIHYQKKEKNLFYCLSLIFFIVALSAKSTPIILPLIITALEMIPSNKTKYKAIPLRLIPFFTISGTYLTLLHINSTQAIKTAQVSGLNTKEFFKGIAVLFFPESVIAAKENTYTALSILFFTSVVGISAFFVSVRFTLLISVMIGVIIAPLLFMSASYVYATPSTPSRYLLGSICHRLYLASIGFSILMGTSMALSIKWAKKYGRLLGLILIVLLAIGILTYGFTYIKEREGIWRSLSEKYVLYTKVVKDATLSLDSQSVVSKIYMVNFPIGFIESIFRLYLNNSTLAYERVRDYTQIPDLKSSGKETVVLILGGNGKFTDITRDIREYQKLTANCKDIKDKDEADACLKELSRLNQRLYGLNFIISTITANRIFAD